MFIQTTLCGALINISKYHMSIFDIFKIFIKKPVRVHKWKYEEPNLYDDLDLSVEEYAEKLKTYYDKHNYLGKAAEISDKAKDAKASGNYDEVWRSYIDMKDLYLKHASHNHFTAQQTLALDATIDFQMADVLRLEGKHNQALVHIIYWVATSKTPSKTQQQKLKAYFNRCKFKNITIDDVYQFIDSLRPLPDFVKIRDTVKQWVVTENAH